MRSRSATTRACRCSFDRLTRRIPPTAALPETGGAATFVRRAYNDVYGFLTGWALFLDYLIVIALSTVFLPHYLGTALGVDALRDSPWDIVVAVTVIPRLVRARNAGAAIVREAERRATELVVIGAPRKDLPSRKRAIFGRTVDYVLKNAPCRVLVTAVKGEAA